MESDHGRFRNSQRNIEVNNHIRELASIVKALANHITSTISKNERNTPSNTQDVVNHDTLCDFDTIILLLYASLIVLNFEMVFIHS